MRRKGAVRLQRMLDWNHQLALAIDGESFPRAEFESLQGWQQSRLARTFADLTANEAYQPAVTFFLTDLYGGLDFRDRDQDIARVMPVMRRFLPDNVLYIMSEAFELQGISLAFDMSMADRMRDAGIIHLDMPRYGETYRAVGERREREQQILLIRKVGYDLAPLVDKAFVNALLRLLRGPANAAGFGKLQAFLEAGLHSFRALDDIGYFVETIREREWDSMDKLFAGEEKPFGW